MELHTFQKAYDSGTIPLRTEGDFGIFSRMRSLLTVLTLSCGLGFSACSFSGSEGDDTPPPPVCEPRFLDLCEQPEPLDNFIVASTTINTDQDSRCKPLAQMGGPEICLLHFKEVEIQQGGTLVAYGSRPLALAATDAMRIFGTVDVSSKRSQQQPTQPAQVGAGSAPTAPGLCAFTGSPEAAAGGGGGGAGGTFATKGGDGGIGNTDNAGGGTRNRAGGLPGTALALPSILRGGCNGQPGAPGKDSTIAPSGLGGGAVYLFAPSLQLTGSVLANGSGADIPGGDDGGNGGGSGGMIVVESDSLAVSGLLLATAGGGAKGGNGNDPGLAGADAGTSTPVIPALGGTGGDLDGDGGNGSISGDGSPGRQSRGGGGGGGGGVGHILLLGPAISVDGSTIIPPATQRVN